MPLNSVKLYSKQGYYDEVYEELEGTPKPGESDNSSDTPENNSPEAVELDPKNPAGLSNIYTRVPDQPIDINTAPTVDPAPTLSQPNEVSEPTKPAGLGNIYTRVPDQPIETDTEDGNFTRGLKAGIDQTQALGGGLKALAGSIFGKDDWVEDGMAYYQEQMAEAEQNAGDVMTIEEIDSVSDFGAWSAYTLGTIVPDLVGMAATMGIGSTVVKESAKAAIKKNAEKMVEKGRDELIERGMEKEAADKIAAEVAEQYAEAKAKQYSLKGGTGAAILYGTGQAASNQFAQTLLDTGEEAPYISLTSGLAQGALNALPAFKVLSDMIPASLRDDTIRVIEEGVNQPWVGEFLKDVATVQGLEGMTEGLQYIIEQEVIAYVNNNFTDNEAIEYFDYIANEKKRSGLINSTAAGFLSGTVTGTAGATVKKVRGGYNEIDPELNVLIRPEGLPEGEKSSQRRESVDVEDAEFVDVEDAEFVEIDESESTDVQTLQQRRQFIADTFNKYKNKSTVSFEDSPPRPIDPVTGELAVAWNESGALNPETNLPYTREERREAGIALLTDYQVERQSAESRFNEQQEKAIDNSLAQLREQYGDNFDPARVSIQGIEDGGVSVIYDETGMDLSDEPEQESPALSDAEKAEREARREESIKLLTDYQVQRSDDTMTPIEVDQELMSNLPLASRSVPEGNQGYGHDHKWDGDLTDVSTPVQDQLLQVSQKSQTPEAQDPTNTDVVVEPIDQDDIDRVFDRNETLKIGTNDKPKGKSLPTVDEAYGDNADTVTNAVGGVMADLSAQGVPVKFIDAVSGVFVHNQDDIDAPALTGKNSRGISINSELIDGALTDQDQLRELAWTMTHEVYHAADYAFDLSSKDESFGISIVDSDKPRVEMGAVMEEIFDNWERGTPMGKRFDYPFNDFHEQILDPETNNDALAVRMQQEVFAQLGALFHSNPAQLQEFAPTAYNYIKGIRDSNLKTAQVEVQDEQPSSPVTQETAQPSGISGQVRAPPEPRGEQVVQPEPTGSDGEGSAVQQRTDTPVARSEQDESGQRQRSDVQQPALDQSAPERITHEKVKRSDNFQFDGTYDVSYPDGAVYQMFRDAVSNPSQPSWNLDPSNYDLLGLSFQDPARVMGIGSNRKEALAWLDDAVNRQREKKQETEQPPTEEQLIEQELGQVEDNTEVFELTDDDLADLDEMGFIKKGSEFLLETSKGTVSDKDQVPVKKLNSKNAEANIKKLDAIIDKHPNALSSPRSWRSFERSLTGNNTHIAPPYALIRMFGRIESWVDRHSMLTKDQELAAKNGLATAKRMGELYTSGVATPASTAKLLLWGLLSRRLTASSQEAAYVDLVMGTALTDSLIQKTIDGTISDSDKNAWIAEVNRSIPQGSFGRSAISNANDFFPLLLKMSQQVDGVSKLQRLHDNLADASMPSYEVRRQFQADVQGSGVDNKVFSFMMLMMGRDDVVILDRIQLNSMWDAGRYGRLIYDYIADEFSGFHGLARYEALENALNTKVKELYTRLGRPEDASVGRYHWESWVLNSGQVVAHPTIQGLEKEIRGEKGTYAFLGAPEGKGDMYRFGAIYARDEDNKPYIIYAKSNGDIYRFSPPQFGVFLDEVKKPKNGVVPSDFKVTDYDKGSPWYDAEQVDRQKLDELVETYAERKAVEREYGAQTATDFDATDVSGKRRRIDTYNRLRGARSVQRDSRTNESTVPRRFRARPSRTVEVNLDGQTFRAFKHELLPDVAKSLSDVDTYSRPVLELESSPATASYFAQKIQASKEASRFGAAVYVYPESDYQKMKLFVTDDGTAGLAIKEGNDIVSLFNDGTNNNVTYPLASLAVDEGAKYLDAFDTQLPFIYQNLGFKAVSRIKWDDEFAPSDWDKSTFSVFNNGEPDVVFMAHDPNYFSKYSRGDGVVVSDYDEAVRIQRGGQKKTPLKQNKINKTTGSEQDYIPQYAVSWAVDAWGEATGLSPREIDALAETGDYQRGDPEIMMVKAQREMGSGVKSFVLEHLGDLVDRMSARHHIGFAADESLDKIDKVLKTLEHRYGHDKEAEENFVDTARYYNVPLKEFRNKANIAVSRYTEAHKKIPVYTEVHALANEATIAYGEGNTEKAAQILRNLRDRIDTEDKFIQEVSRVNLNMKTFAERNAVTPAPTQAVSDVVDDIDEPSFIKKKQQNKELNKLDDGTPSTNKFTYNDEIDSQADLARRLKDSKIYRSLVDRYAPLEDFEQQAAEYLELGRLPAAISPRDQENLSHGRVQLDLDEFHEKHVDPIGDLIAELGYTVEAVDIYLIAKHAAERNDAIAEKVKEQRARNIQRTEDQILKLQEDIDVDHSVQIANLMEKLQQYEELPLAFQDTGSGMTYDEAQKVLDLAEQEGTQADMERIAEKVYEMLGEYRERMVTSGLLDEDTKADWEERFEFYVPLKGFAAQDDGETYVRDATSRGFSVVGKESMKARGRKTLPFSPLLTSFEDVQKKIIRARKNEYANTLLDLLSELGNSESYTIYNTKFRPMKESDELTQQDLREMSLDVRPNGDPKYVEVKRDGQTFFIYFESDALNHTLQNMSVPMLSRANESMGKLLNLATRFQNFRRNMLINYNPTWGLVNPLRDVQTGLMYALAEMDKKGSRVKGENLIGKMSQSYLPSMRALYRNYRGKPAREGNEMDQFVVEYREDGAPTGMMLMKDADEQLRILKNKIKRGTVRDLLKGIGKFVEDFNTTMENSIRLAAYVEARKAGASREDAATLAKDLTVNFNRKGEDTAVINAGYLFFNAAVQGNMNILQAMADDGGKGSKKTTTARKAALGMVAIGSALALFNILSSEEDDDGELLYDDLPEHAKNRSLLFMWSKDEGFALPAPYGYNFFTNAGRLSTELALGINDEKETAQYLWENFLLNFVPVAPSAGDSWEDAARGFYPDLLEAHLDLLANKNFFGSDIYIEQNPLFVERSKAYNARRSTDKMFTVPAQFLNDLTGGDKYKDGWLAMNPDKVQYVYEYLLGGVGRFASQTTDVASRMIADEEYRKQDLPIVGAFFESPSEYEDRFEFYANWEETRKIVTRFKEATSADEIRQLQEEYKAYIPLLENRYGGKNMYELANRDLRRISKARKIIERQDYGSGADVEMKRRQMLEDLLASENKIFDLFNKAYREAERQ